MSRVLKFRAWDGQKMLGSDGEGHLVVDFSTGEVQKIHHGSTPFNLSLPRGLQVMQWTGLVDKSGKAIYEDDLVTMSRRFYTCTDKYGAGGYLWPVTGIYGSVLDVTGEVEWIWTGRVAFHPTKGWHLRDVTSQGWRFESRDDDKPASIQVRMRTKSIKPRAYELEGIGNIHETPELLEAA